MSEERTVSSPDSGILEPPETLFGSLRYLGPGLILSAAIVGSGELIATTTLGMNAGFALLWVILLGCLAKVTVQLEFGKYCIVHGTTTYQSWNDTGKTKIAGLHWTVCIGLLFMLVQFFGQGGVLGGSVQVGMYYLPALTKTGWVFLLAILLGSLVYHGKYAPVEIAATVMNGIFVVLILGCLFMVQQTDSAITFSELQSGFNPLHFPPEYAGYALAAFGITGVAAGEVAMYPFWCIEKGYAKWTGPKDGSDAWVRRAKGWIRVMTLDALLSMVVYTITTCAFYLLGASILLPYLDQFEPDDPLFITKLSVIFTDVMGNDAQIIFMVCAFAVLFSTIFANTAGFSRLWTEFFGLAKWINLSDKTQRARSIAVMAFVFPLLCGIAFLAIPDPWFLVTVMGINNALFLIVVAYKAVIFRYGHTDKNLQPSIFYDIAFWISFLSIGFMAVQTSISVINTLMEQ